MYKMSDKYLPTNNNNSNPNTTSKKILLGVTGSVAAIKAPELAVRLIDELGGAQVCVLLTQYGAHFWSKACSYNPQYWLQCEQYINIKALTVIHHDQEWDDWNELGDDVLHIHLRDWADICIVAPLSANTLAKMANGLCDDTLSCVLRAWDFGQVACRRAKPIVLAPAMNTAMYEHPITAAQLDVIKGFGGKNSTLVIEPQVKALACGEVGKGAMANPSDIVLEVSRLLPQF